MPNPIPIHSLHYGTSKKPRFDLVCYEALYRIGVQARLWAYRHHVIPIRRLPVPVISIGNLTTGGTGKTPVTINLAQFLESRGLRVAVLSRGYAGRVRTNFHEADSPDYGDEPFLIQQQLARGKVFVGKDRVFTGNKAVQVFQPNVILMDDGFQYIRLHRDINILLVDADYGFGNGHLLPAGPLREPVAEIRRADRILLTRKNSSLYERSIREHLKQQNSQERIPVAYCPFRPTGLLRAATQYPAPLEYLHQKPIFLLSGIAQPNAYEAMIQESLQAKLLEHFVFPDHHRYSPQDIAALVDKLQSHPDVPLVTTEKDWVKLAEIFPSELSQRTYLLRIRPIFDWTDLLAPIESLLKA